ncbi:MAG: hypothetical protein ACHQ53_12220 [Polyangiales bacterium]
MKSRLLANGDSEPEAPTETTLLSDSGSENVNHDVRDLLVQARIRRFPQPLRQVRGNPSAIQTRRFLAVASSP